ncbi:Peptidoglycan/LPS O-acetylase OafA/YrhL, contains acyltransferase and SGNH-hydrolase domains [Mycobacterium numidiamassiliense]|uniref:Peptidoglycan/LPS O-acetylase OafA/YrhL, contains acyltransferase and SGNH-hydrolase domains n=1 Tax=Mycobacterium numidiamassiliense TaxID=1841861 RepID=A0A2U3PH46_9MYCO|nr:acyltransferase [Mycobacterium numidiamassiliense]SPM43092.1 Peptidoglycan/LPS O-acetylase OafA/YrhL, contains acyltransferase and SGNH-hydrolase domains [Mycobacterium numidiamassiliense]
MTLGEQFDPRRNALNAWRLALATGVIVWHSFLTTGHHVPFAPVRQLLSEVFVDGFFAVSGFLITASWFNNPRLRDYFVARALRILPGVWVCLIVTAFVVAPIGISLQGGSAANLMRSGAPFAYVLNNIPTVGGIQFDIGGTPTGIPYPGYWNSSIWTLIWEVFCYIAIAVLGVVGLLRRRWLIPAAFAVALSLAALVTLPAEPTFTQMLAYAATRFAVMFLAGALLYQVRNVIPARWPLVAVSVVVVLASSLLSDYRLVAALPLAYALLVSGALIHSTRLRLRTDLSYGVYIYAFPIQQLLVIGGLASLNPMVFAVIAAVATLPVAALSWFLVEKPAMSLKSRLKRRGVAPVAGPSVAVSS